MTSGRIAGGWFYVWMAYIVTATFLLGYTALVVSSYRAKRRSVEKER